MLTRRVASIWGILFLLIGVVGFVPGLSAAHDHPDVVVKTGLGLALGLFPVNLLHNLFHLAFGALGLLAGRGPNGARNYLRAVAVIYGALAVLGLISAGNLHTTFGLVPLYGHDVWLHLLLALPAAYFGFVHRERDETVVRTSTTRVS